MSTVPRSPDSRPLASTTPAKESQAPQTAERKSPQRCTHPRVQVVAREEDAEFVECLECREVFEASEFRDMAIEERIEDSSVE